MKILVCPPEFFDVWYEINAWMDIHNTPHKARARSQWWAMYNALLSSGAQVQRIEPHPRYPDMVFTANAGLVRKNSIILSNFKHEQRQGEQFLFKKWFVEHGYNIIELPPDVCFEGEGDALFFKDLLFMGHGFRTDIESHKHIGRVLGVECVSLELVNPKFYHLDTCLFTSDTQVCFYKDALTPESLRYAMGRLINYVSKNNLTVKITSVSKEDADNFICNSIEIRKRIVSPVFNCDKVFGIGRHRFCDMSEFKKSGGAVKCLTLKL